MSDRVSCDESDLVLTQAYSPSIISGRRSFAFAHRPDDLAVDCAKYIVLQLGFSLQTTVHKLRRTFHLI